MRTITVDDGGGATDLTISGWPHFRDYIEDLSALLQSAYDWAAEYDEDLDRIVLTPGMGGGTIDITFESDSMRALWGSADLTGISTETTLASPPDGVVPLLGQAFQAPTSARSFDFRPYRFGRGRSVVWGDGAIYRCLLQFEREHLERLCRGPCSTGKIRVGLWTSPGMYSDAEPTGHVDGFILDWPTAELQGRAEHDAALCQFQATLHAPSTAHNPMESLGHSVFGSLKRGYSLAYYYRCEGLPYLYTELTYGLSAPTGYTVVNGVLVVDDSQALRSQLSQTGAPGGSGFTVRILDETPSRAEFIGPSLSTVLTDDLDATDTAATVSDTTGMTGLAGIYIGTEFATFSGSTGTTFTGLTRGTWGPKYDYRAAGSTGYVTVANAPLVWRGRIGELWAILVDPYGLPVASAYDGTHTIQVAVGEIDASRPVFAHDAWTLPHADLARRLTRGTGISGEAETADYSADWGAYPVLVQTGQTAHVSAVAYLTNPGDATATVDIFAALGSPAGTVTLRELWQTLIDQALALDLGSGTLAADDYAITVGAGQYLEASTTILLDCSMVASPATYNGVNIQIKIGAPLPYWAKQYPIFKTDVQDGGTSWISTLDASTEKFAVQESGESAFAPGLSSSGVVACQGEVIEYDARTTLDNGKYLLHTTKRNVNGIASLARVLEPGHKVTSAYEFSGPPSEIIAAILESSGTALRGIYDTGPQGSGYGLDDSYVSEANATGILYDLSVYQSAKLAEVAKGLAVLGYAVGWRRETRRLKLGLVAWEPIAGVADVSMSDADLAAQRPITEESAKGGANVVTVSRAKSPLEDTDAATGTVTVMDREGVQTQGVISQSVQLFTDSEGPDWASWAYSAAHRMIIAQQFQVFRCRVAPYQDWLPGQIVELDVSYAGCWDAATGAVGLSGYGRILEASRHPVTQECEVTILTRGTAGQAGMLCPAVKITANSGADITVSDASFFAVDDPILIYTPGVASSREERTIDSIAGSVLTLDGAPGVTIVNNVTMVTYPSDDNGGITDLQAAHTHCNDGGVYV